MFARLPPFAAADAAHICRLVLMQALPALVEADLTSFAAAIKDMQTILGAYFARLQGGFFASREVAAAMEVLESEGAVGIGQSSWGPTAFAFARSGNEARRLSTSRVTTRVAGPWISTLAWGSIAAQK